ncbi:unnamed protein product [Ceutorhynchus assimilis]|uniref:Glycoside hydrolase family 31 n=1 Tax=Ceutorhynchus assimilis TaxID=467358 RepID=A0A9N9MIG8_9CUCU|nr:unnamed protein product [Ceutorhynchus assimilis]
MEKSFWLVLWATILLQCHALDVKVISSGVVDMYLNYTKNGIDIELVRGNISKLKGTIGVGIDFTRKQNFSVVIIDVNNGFKVQWFTNDTTMEIFDCFNLDRGNLNWFGGPEIYRQEWPIEKLRLNQNDAYVVRKDLNFAVPERYWLNSNGAFIFVEDRVPLFIDQNLLFDDRVCFIAKNQGPYINRTTVRHSYYLVALDDAVQAHKVAVANFLGQAQSLPNINMIRDPIWTTWAKYKKYINDSVVRDFAYDILAHGFRGQIEIDEQWETCFGSREFLPNEFGNITAVVRDLQNKQLRVTLWAAPFVNPECEDLISEGEQKGYYVKNTQGDMTTVWWESTNARQIDFTNPEAREWYSKKLRKLLENPGVDSFKFDAGEVDYVAQPALYPNQDPELIPNIFTQRYIDTVTQFGDLIEARSAFRTQNYTYFLRMIDKDSVWDIEDGLQSLIPTLLQLNMVGYNFILPDMIGGNGYKAQPTLELLVRWTQATVFMPVLQFSYLPWDFADDDVMNGTAIIRSMIELHEKYTPNIVEAMENSLKTQTPTNPPVWWLGPNDPILLETNDAYLLGEKILVAPVLNQGQTSRSVYLPLGVWQDGNDETKTYDGPVSISYDAPLSVLPFFIKLN